MKEVSRYDPGCDYAGQDEMVESADGEYVAYEDYAALEQRAEAAEAKLAELDKQEHYVEVMKDGHMTICHWMKPAEELPDGAKLFTRPAPAADVKQDCDHEWFTLHYGHTEAIYGCEKCGQYKTGQGNY